MTRSMRAVAPLLAVVIAAPVAAAQDVARPDGVANVPAAAPAALTAHSAAAVTTTGPAVVERGPQVGPTAGAAAAGVRVHRAAATAPAPMPRREETTQNRAMMIVGGAGLIVGAIIGDTAGTLVMVGSAGIGLYGLYKYLE